VFDGLDLPAMQYSTPVTMQADTCFCMIANVPTAAAAARSIRLTIKHEAAEFCIPGITHTMKLYGIN